MGFLSLNRIYPIWIDLIQGKGQVSGILSTDTVAIGSLSVESQFFGAINRESEDFNYEPNDGLIGLAFGTIAQSKKPTFFENLIEAKKVTSPMFSIHLTRNQVVGSEVCSLMFWKALSSSLILSSSHGSVLVVTTQRKRLVLPSGCL